MAFIVTGTLISSCLKDDIVLDPSKSNNVIEFANPSDIVSPATAPFYQYLKTYSVNLTEVDYPLVVSFSGADVAPVDINVVVGVGPASVLTQYNTNTGRNLVTFPTPGYTITNPNVTIKKGERTATVIVKVRPPQLSFTSNFAVPFTISSASSGIVSGNFGTIIVAFSPRNRFDGVYRYQTSAITSLVPNRDSETELSTLGQNNCSITPGLLDTYSNVVEYTVAPVTNAITVVCPSLGVQTPQDVRSVYNPTTRVLQVFWKQGNGGRTFEETFTYLRDRN